MPIIYSLIYWNELLIQKECGNLKRKSVNHSNFSAKRTFLDFGKVFSTDFFDFWKRNFSEIWSNLETIP